MKIHPVFHTNLLLPASSNPFPDQRHPEPGPVIVDAGEDFWEVEKILDSRTRYGHIQYYVKWKGWDIEDSTWQEVEDVAGAPEAVTSLPLASDPFVSGLRPLCLIPR
jgi:hypothetical protein